MRARFRDIDSRLDKIGISKSRLAAELLEDITLLRMDLELTLVNLLQCKSFAPTLVEPNVFNIGPMNLSWFFYYSPRISRTYLSVTFGDLKNLFERRGKKFKNKIKMKK
jgi:hypothetical protein